VSILLVGLLTVLAVVLAAFASAAVKSLQEYSHNKLEEICRQRNQAALFDQILRRHDAVKLSAESIRVLFTASSVALLMNWLEAAWSWDQLPFPQGLLLDMLWLAGFILLLWLALIWVPNAVVKVYAERVLLWSWPTLNILSRLTIPSAWGAKTTERMLRWFFGWTENGNSAEEVLEDELLSIVSEGHRDGLIEEDAREMIESVMELSEVPVAQIMTPRIYMVSMSVDLPWEEAVQFAVEVGHSRIPVYGKSRDDIVGILHAKDLLAELARKDSLPRSISEILRKAFFVPESKKVSELLPEFQLSRNHMAIVLDEFGGVSGVVTIEDAIEEIVGEIADEYDEALVDGIKCYSDTSCEALARVRIEEINQRLGLSLPDDNEFDTIGGFVFHSLGRIPKVGEELVRDDVRIRVLDASRSRIDRVAIEVLRPSNQPSGSVEVGNSE